MDDGSLKRSDCINDDQRKRWDYIDRLKRELDDEIWSSGSNAAAVSFSSKEDYKSSVDDAFSEMAKGLRESLNKKMEDIVYDSFFDKKV